MAKSQRNQTFVLKLDTVFLRQNKWAPTIDITEARKRSQTIVALGSSQVLRWLESSEKNDADATEIKQQIQFYKQQPDAQDKIQELYDKLYMLQFQPNYVMIVQKNAKDYQFLCKNGLKITIKYGKLYKKTIKYKRFLGTAGSIKKSTIMFVNEEIYDDLMRRINNGRYQGPKDGESAALHNGMPLNYKFIPAKLNAYFALQCSSSAVVSWPRMIVVDDAISKFKWPIRMVNPSGNPRNSDWPYAGDVEEREIEYNVSDGMGLISPEMSAKWASELEEGDEPLSGFNTRCAFLKGMVFTIPFHEFAEEVAGTYEIIDAWGDKRDVRDADIIITTSMLKLWNSYDGMEDYLENCRKNNYDFCVAKTAPRKLRNVHTTNYQYLQDFTMSDEDIAELVEPTVRRIKECLGGDWRKVILYLCGTNLNADNVLRADPMCKTIMANPEVLKDPFVVSKIITMIKKRINSAKIGVLDVEGDYAILGNDPYFFMQNMFKLPIEHKGLLQAGECYHKYWTDKGTDEVIMFRAPMTSHENVCKMRVVCTDEMAKWYRYVRTCCFINAYDTTAIRLNGAD